MLPLPEDYADLLRALVEAEAEFVLVGGWAVAVHGYGRATDDLDVLVRPSQDNALRVYQALDEFGAPLAFHGVTEDLFATPGCGRPQLAARCVSRGANREIAPRCARVRGRRARLELLPGWAAAAARYRSVSERRSG